MYFSSLFDGRGSSRRILAPSLRLSGFFAMLFLCLGSTVLHAAPANDLCTNAMNIPAAGPFPYLTPVVDITTATTNGDPVLDPFTYPIGTATRSVWFKFIPQTAGTYGITTCSDEGTLTTVPDTVMGVYTSPSPCVGPYTLQGVLGDENCGPLGHQAAVTLELAAGTSYYIVVWKYCDPGSSGSCGSNAVQLKISPSGTVTNDTCATAKPVSLNIPVVGTTVNAKDDYRLSAPSCFTGIGQTASSAPGGDAVFRFTAPMTDTYSVRVRSYNMQQNLVLYATTSCPSTGGVFTATECIAAANRNPVSSAEELFCMPLTNGQSIYIFVDDHTANNAGSTFTLEVTRCPREVQPNDSPTNASVAYCEVEGSISPPADVDFYGLGSFPENWRVFAAIDGVSAGITDFDLRVTTTTDTLEFDHADNAITFGETSPNIAGTPLRSGPAYVVVTYNGAAASEPYRLYTVVQPPLALAAAETEPNHTPAQASLDARNYFYGTLAGPAPSTDADLFAFSASVGDLIFLSLDGDPLRNNTPINAALELLDAAGNLLIAANDINASSNTNQFTNTLSAITPNSPGETILYRCWTGGVYYARVSIGTSSVLTNGAGDYLLSITRNCRIGAFGTNHPPALTNVVITPVIEENGVAVLTATLVEMDTGDPLQVTVTWGDGTTNVWPLNSGGVRLLNLQHQYLDDAPSGTSADPYSITLKVTDSEGAAFWTNLAATVVNVPPSPAELTPVPLMVAEGAQFTLNGAFADPGLPDTHQIVIRWGDLTEDSVLNLDAGVTNFFANHVFTNDVPTGIGLAPDTITVIVIDDDGGRSTNSVLIVVSNVPPAAVSIGLSSSVIGEDGTIQLNGTFLDPGVLDAHQVVINWGDGTPNTTQNLNAGTFTFGAMHQYRDEDPSGTPSDFYNIIVTITDSDLGLGQGSTFIIVTNKAPVLSGVSITTPIIVSNNATLSGQIFDIGTPDTFTLTVNWGDGTTPQQFSYPAGTTQFSETHLYNTIRSNYSVSLLLADDDSGFTSASVNLQVRSAAGPALFTEILRQQDGSVLLRVEGTPSGIYRIESSATLAPNSWTLLGNRTADAEGRFEYEDAAPLPAHRFYRARVAD